MPAVLATEELVQINATIIAGILIFMTLALTSFSDKDSSVYRFIITVVTSSVLIPYALSATLSLDEQNPKAVKVFKIALIYSIIVAIVFVILSFLSDILGVLN
jgi:heme O synthase-like polyprenyltransferase